MKRDRGNLFIVSAPSGAGKTTLCQKLSLILPNLRHSVSYTIRPMRQGEVNNRDYIFISEDIFLKMIERGEFVEWAKVHGYLYGTSRKKLESMLNKGIDVILDIDVQGAKQLRKNYSGGVYIFILPPSMKTLRKRLHLRMSNSKQEIETRLKRALVEIRDYKKYDYVIINDGFKDALEGLKSIVISEKVRTEKIDPLWIKEKFFHLNGFPPWAGRRGDAEAKRSGG